MSICAGCKKKGYCKKECRPAREERDLEIRRAFTQALKDRGLLGTYQAIRANGYKA